MWKEGGYFTEIEMDTPLLSHTICKNMWDGSFSNRISGKISIKTFRKPWRDVKRLAHEITQTSANMSVKKFYSVGIWCLSLFGVNIMIAALTAPLQGCRGWRYATHLSIQTFWYWYEKLW